MKDWIKTLLIIIGLVFVFIVIRAIIITVF